MGRVREVFAAMGREMRKNKGSFAVYVVLRLIVLACAVGSLAFDNYEAFFLCLLTLVLFLVPTFIEVNFSISIPETLEVVIALFIFAAEILGSCSTSTPSSRSGMRCCIRSTGFWLPL